MSKSHTIAIVATSITATLLYAMIPKPQRLKPGSVVIITGGSRGLGLAIAHRFAKAGMKLVLAARNADELELVRDGLLRTRDLGNEDDVLLVVCDLTDSSQVAGFIDSTLRAFGRIDCLINNAGIIEVGPVEDQPLEAYERAMSTNFFAALHTIQAALPTFLRQRAGAIVNIASIGGKIPVPHLLPYVASKFALVGFSEGLHAELRHKGIRVTTVCPGLMRTGGENHAIFTGHKEEEQAWFNFGAKTPLLAATAEHAANRIYNAVQAGRAEITITPQAWLGARVVGLAPAASQIVAALANQYILPAPLAAEGPVPTLHVHEEEAQVIEPFADPSPS